MVLHPSLSNRELYEGEFEVSKHNFIQSSDGGSLYKAVIYCTWCGIVAWHFNITDTSRNELQKRVGESCIPSQEANQS